MLKYLGATTALSLFFSMASCDKDESKSYINRATVVENYAAIVYANYTDALNDAKELQTKISAFTATPSEAGLQDAKDAWLQARESYGQSEVFRFWGGPVDDENGPEGALNAWPLDEFYIDYVYNTATSQTENNGLIADITFGLTQSNIVNQNEAIDEKSISIGYHSIEFLLWGQDLNMDGSGSLDYSNAGQREYTDYTTADYAERRRTFLNIVAQQLVDDLQYLVDAWKDDNAWGRKALLEMENLTALQSIFTGMGKLSKGELAGERMYAALKNHDQEEEHSCFSDNTHRDIYTNALGIKNIWYGTYENISGPSVYDLVKEQNPTLAEQVNAHVIATWTKIEAVDSNKPFDYAISAGNSVGNDVILQAVQALQEQGDLLVEAASSLGITFVADLED